MTKSRIAPFFLIALLGLLLAACGAPPAASWPGISVDDASGTAYVAFNQDVYALQIDNGAQRWRFRPEDANNFQTYAPPALTADGQLLVGAYNNVLYSIDPANGSQNWTFAGGGNRYIGGALESSDTIYAPNSDHRLYALNASGELLWSFSASEPLWSQPASDGSGVYLAAMDHMLYALDASSGDLLWEQDLGGTLIGSPVLGEDGVIYIGTLNKEILALDSRNGGELWSFTTDGWVWGSPMLFEGQLFAGDLEGRVYALDAEGGQELWRVTTEGAITGTPLVTAENIYVVNENGDVVSITIEGTIRWTRNMETPLYGSVVQAGDLLLIGMTNIDTIVVALDENGDTVWSFIPAN